jgi:hypothetical protein
VRPLITSFVAVLLFSTLAAAEAQQAGRYAA